MARGTGKHFVELFQNVYHSDAYREQSKINRKQFFIKDNFQYAQAGVLKSMLMMTDLFYETPGGLTQAQMNADRRQSRPSTATLPGAAEQKASITNRMLLAGIFHHYDFGNHFSHFILIQAAYNDFRNPFITNYEQRYERNMAVRTHVNYEIQHKSFYLAYRLGLGRWISNYPDQKLR